MLLSLLAIFILVSVSFFASLKLIDFILEVGTKVESVFRKRILTLAWLLGLFCVGLATTLWLSTILVNIPTSSPSLEAASESSVSRGIILSQEDCPALIDTVYSTENEIYQLENHRHIESGSQFSEIKDNYLKGSEKLSSAAQDYQLLPVSVATKSYTRKVSNLLKKKAALFKERSSLQNDSAQLESLLKQMDFLTDERQSLIDALEKQCVLSN